MATASLAEIAEHRWKVVSDSPGTGFRAGDEVAPARKLSWEEARRRVNSDRSALSPSSLILIRGAGLDLTEEQISELFEARRRETKGFPPAA